MTDTVPIAQPVAPHQTVGPLVLPTGLGSDERINNNERLFCARLIAAVAASGNPDDELILSNIELTRLSRCNHVNTSLALTKLSSMGHLTLTYNHLGRGRGSVRKIRLTDALKRDMVKSFGPHWPRLFTP